MTYYELEINIYKWLELVLPIGTSIIQANENGPRPSLPYVMFDITSITKIGQSYRESEIGTDGIQTIRYDEDFTLEIQAFGGNAHLLLQELKDSLQRESIIQYLDNCLGIAVRTDNTINNIALLIDNTIEKRWMYEVFMGFAHTTTDYTNYIEDVEIEKTYLGGNS